MLSRLMREHPELAGAIQVMPSALHQPRRPALMALANYTFLPWLRRGIANQIETAAGAGASRARLSR